LPVLHHAPDQIGPRALPAAVVQVEDERQTGLQIVAVGRAECDSLVETAEHREAHAVVGDELERDELPTGEEVELGAGCPLVGSQAAIFEALEEPWRQAAQAPVELKQALVYGQPECLVGLLQR
jgi:hypothetical protein